MNKHETNKKKHKEQKGFRFGFTSTWQILKIVLSQGRSRGLTLKCCYLHPLHLLRNRLNKTLGRQKGILKI